MSRVVSCCPTLIALRHVELNHVDFVHYHRAIFPILVAISFVVRTLAVVVSGLRLRTSLPPYADLSFPVRVCSLMELGTPKILTMQDHLSFVLIFHPVSESAFRTSRSRTSSSKIASVVVLFVRKTTFLALVRLISLRESISCVNLGSTSPSCNGQVLRKPWSPGGRAFSN